MAIDYNYQDIIDNNLDTGANEVIYDPETNQLQVYTNVAWDASEETKKQYKEKETLIENYSIENHLFSLKAWCDISGYEYWKKECESTKGETIRELNYVSVDVCLKKPVEQYDFSEIVRIIEAIDEADDYFLLYVNNA